MKYIRKLYILGHIVSIQNGATPPPENRRPSAAAGFRQLPRLPCKRAFRFPVRPAARGAVLPRNGRLPRLPVSFAGNPACFVNPLAIRRRIWYNKKFTLPQPRDSGNALMGAGRGQKGRRSARHVRLCVASGRSEKKYGRVPSAAVSAAAAPFPRPLTILKQSANPTETNPRYNCLCILGLSRIASGKRQGI